LARGLLSLAFMKTRHGFSSLLLLVALTSACDGSDSGPDGTGGNGTGGNGTGGGNGGTGAIDPGGPLLARTSGARYSCSVSRPIARLGTEWAGFSLVSSAAGAQLAVAVAEFNNPDPNNQGSRIIWSTLGLDGTLGSPTVLRPPTTQFLGSVTAAIRGDKSTIVWGENNSDNGGASFSLKSAQVNAAGAVATPSGVLATLSRSTAAKIVKAGSGYALLWLGGDESSAKLSFGLLDESGKLASSPVVLAQGPYLGVGNIAPVGDHFVVSYADFQFHDSGLVSRLLVLDSDGRPLRQPIAFEGSGATGFGATVPSLLVHGDQVLAAWSVVSEDGSFETEDAAITVRVARFDANGERQGLIYDLQAPVKDREAVQPTWIEVGDDVGLLWAEGGIIYICAGCVPDHSLKLVVLDGQTFFPQSNVVELVNTLPSGGLLSPATAAIGDALLVVSTVTYHTSGEGASAAIRCAQ
jgi:hypothetical protein